MRLRRYPHRLPRWRGLTWLSVFFQRKLQPNSLFCAAIIYSGGRAGAASELRARPLARRVPSRECAQRISQPRGDIYPFFVSTALPHDCVAAHRDNDVMCALHGCGCRPSLAMTSNASEHPASHIYRRNNHMDSSAYTFLSLPPFATRPRLDM